MPTGELLAAAVRRPRDPQLPSPPVFAPRLTNELAVERFAAHRAPDPIRSGDTPSRPSRMPVAYTLATRAWQATANDFFVLPVFASRPIRPDMPRGKLAPFRMRANIDSPIADAYGSQFALVAGPAPGALSPLPLAGLP